MSDEEITAGAPRADYEYIGRIQSKYHSLTKKQKQLARYFIDNADTIATMSIGQIAAKAGTQPSSITRFCTALGYKGFSEYKFQLSRGGIIPHDPEDPIGLSDPLPVISQKLLAMNTRAISETLSSMDEDTLILAADALLKAKRVFIFGQGGPNSSIDFARHLLLQVGIVSQAVSDSSTMLISAALMEKDDAAIIISFSGETAPVIEAAAAARRGGAKIIAVTAAPSSPAIKLAHFRFCYSRSIPDDLFYLHTSRICEIITVSMIQTYIKKRMSDLSRLPKITSAITRNRSRRPADESEV